MPHSDRFPWILFLVALGAVTGGHWLATRLFHLAVHGAHFAGMVVSLVATCLFALALRHAHHRHPHPREKRHAALQFLLVWFVFGSGIWFALAAEEWLLHGAFHLEHHLGVFLSIGFVFVVGFSFLHSRLSPGFQRPRSFRPVRACELPVDQRFQALVICVSARNLPCVLAPSPEVPPKTHALVTLGSGEGIAKLLGVSAKEDSDEIDRAASVAHEEARRAAQAAGRPTPRKPYWNWQQLLRAIAPHPQLAIVRLIGSPGDSGSFDQLSDCCRFLAPYLPNCDLTFVPDAVDFENFDRLVETVRGLLGKDLARTPAHHIGIDVTGGQKVTSIAGAALTMNRELRFQYVQTNAPYEALTYRLVYELPPSPHGH